MSGERTIPVRRLPVDPGPAGWNEILPPAASHPALEEACEADFLVVGAGFAGLAAARRLLQLRPGASVVVLEARRVAEGPAGRNSGFMIDLPHDLSSEDYGGDAAADRAQIVQNRAAIEFSADAAREYAMAPQAFERSGKINAAAAAKGHRHNEDFARHLESLGEACRMLDAGEMRELTGSGFFVSGLFTPGAAMIQPALFIRSLAAGLVDAGARVFEQSPATSLQRREGGWAATTPTGTVRAAEVVLAVNGHAESFGFFRRRLIHTFTFASMTRALEPAEIERLGGAPSWSATPADPMGTTLRRITGSGGDRLVVRNTFTVASGMRVGERRLRRIWRDHDRSWRNRFPMLNDVDMEYRWGGQLALAWNNVGAVKRLEPGLTSACCQNGLGTTRGTLAGMMAAEVATGDVSDMAQALLAEPMPTRLPPAWLADFGANAWIRFNEWRAGIER